MSTESDAPIGSRLIAADRHARITKKFDGKWLAGLHEITILDSSCTRFPDFQIDTDNKSCTFTLLGTTYKGMLQQDGLNITWSDNSTWTLIKPNHADEEEESLTTTEPADSECSNKRRRHHKRHRHRKRRHHRSRTRRKDDSSSSRNPIVKTQKNAWQHCHPHSCLNMAPTFTLILTHKNSPNQEQQKASSRSAP